MEDCLEASQLKRVAGSVPSYCLSSTPAAVACRWRLPSRTIAHEKGMIRPLPKRSNLMLPSTSSFGPCRSLHKIKSPWNVCSYGSLNPFPIRSNIPGHSKPNTPGSGTLARCNILSCLVLQTDGNKTRTFIIEALFVCAESTSEGMPGIDKSLTLCLRSFQYFHN